MKKLLLNLCMLTSITFAMAQNANLKEVNLTNDLKLNVSQNDFRGEALSSNLDFEFWFDDYASLFGEIPNGWFMQTGNLSAQKATNAQSGNFAMHVESNVITNQMMGWTDTLIGGQAFIGQVQGTSINQGEAFNKRPSALHLYTKGNMMNSDTAVILLQLYDNTNTMVGAALGLFGTDDLSTDEWKEHKLDFEYFKENNPTKAYMIVTSTGVGIFKNTTIGTLSEGSYIEVDNMSLDLNDAIEEKEVENAYLYPNPAKNLVVVENAINSQISIINMLGQTVLHTTVHQAQEHINIAHLPASTYVVRIEKDGNVSNHKLRVTN